MLNQNIKYLATLSVGILIGYFLTHSETSIEAQSDAALASVHQSNESLLPHDEPIKANNSENVLLQEPTGQLAHYQQKISELTALLATQKEQLSLLQAQQVSLNTDLKKSDKDIAQQSEKSLETISMEDFETEIKGNFLDRFKGYAIELKPEQLVEIKKTFERDQDKSEWGANFENQISEFISNADLGGLHFINEINCHQSICRLNIQSNHTEHWNKIYGDMTSQPWYKSMTFIEKSDTPGNLIYYIPKS